MSFCCVSVVQKDSQNQLQASMINALTAGCFSVRTMSEVFNEVGFRTDVIDPADPLCIRTEFM